MPTGKQTEDKKYLFGGGNKVKSQTTGCSQTKMQKWWFYRRHGKGALAPTVYVAINNTEQYSNKDRETADCP